MAVLVVVGSGSSGFQVLGSGYLLYSNVRGSGSCVMGKRARQRYQDREIL